MSTLRIATTDRSAPREGAEGRHPHDASWHLVQKYFRRCHAWERRLGDLLREREALDAFARDLVTAATATEAGTRDPAADGEASTPLPMRVEAYERELILRALAACGGKQRDAAAALRIPATTLNEKLRRLGLRGTRRDQKHSPQSPVSCTR